MKNDAYKIGAERARQILEKGISDLEFQDLDSAKILAGVGKGFAGAMVELKKAAPANP